jgi:hypothetical protein
MKRVLLAAVLALAGCLNFDAAYDETARRLDAGVTNDAGLPADGGADDAGLDDAGVTDAGAVDAGADAGVDAGPAGCARYRLEFLSASLEDSGVTAWLGTSVGDGGALLIASGTAGLVVRQLPSGALYLVDAGLVYTGTGVTPDEQFTVDFEPAFEGGGLFTQGTYRPSGCPTGFSAEAVTSRVPHVGLFCGSGFAVCEANLTTASLRLPAMVSGGICNAIRERPNGEVWRAGSIDGGAGLSRRAVLIPPDGGLAVFPSVLSRNVANFDVLPNGTPIVLDTAGVPRTWAGGQWIEVGDAGQTFLNLRALANDETWLVGAGDLMVFDGERLCTPELLNAPAWVPHAYLNEVRDDGQNLVMVGTYRFDGVNSTPVVLTFRRSR